MRSNKIFISKVNYHVDYNSTSPIQFFIAMYHTDSRKQLFSHIEKWARILKTTTAELLDLETIEDYNDPLGAIDKAIVSAHLSKVMEMEDFPELFAQIFGED